MNEQDLAHSANDAGIFLDNGPDSNGDTSDESSYSPLVFLFSSFTLFCLVIFTGGGGIYLI